jgi:tyrosine-protein phosphatase YwqE
MHSVELRPPLIEEAFFNIEKRFGADEKRVILNNANRLFAYVEK